MKSCLGVLSVVALLLFSGYGTVEAAVKAHTESCNACHRMVGGNPRAVNSLCLACHVSGGPALAQTAGTFSVSAASNAFNHNPSAGTGAGSQSSHFWGGSKTAMPEAGSQNPSAAFYTSRNALSTGLMTCSICHDPHGNKDTTIKQLRTTTAATTDIDDTVCKQCHATYFVNNDYASLTHPVGPLAVPSADPLKFNASVVNIGAGTIQYAAGSVSCSTCHSVHYADSDSTTMDGKGQVLAAGDGKLLRTDGALVTGSTLQDTANRRSAVCTACHPYKTHGNALEPVGCLGCHSAHVYKATGTPNYYVLRNNVTTATFGAKTDMVFTSLGASNTTWANGVVGSAGGYCEKCHGDTNTMPGSSRVHSELTDDCRTCHAHNTASNTRSFEATGCDGCHGFPPATNVAVSGYAVDSVNGYNYSLSPAFKDESLTPHPSHSGAASGGYNFSCGVCHNAYDSDSLGTHDKGTFQDVLVAGQPYDTNLVKPDGLSTTPTYSTTGAGTCSNVACHSNGGKRTGDGTRTYKTTAPTWANAKNTISTCDACHGNSVASMAVAQKDNSTSHIAHLNLGYSCQICHAGTATSATALVAGAAGLKHVNGTVEVSIPTYVPATGTCTVSCHMSATPDWDVAASGDCGTCHQYSVGGVATGTGTPLPSTHNKHVYSAANGVQLACTVCHTNNGPGTGTGHADSTPSLIANYQNAICNPCHGSTSGVTTGNDRQPVWANTTSVECATCHVGVVATINTRTAPVKNNFTTTGHGSIAAFNTANPTAPCNACHVMTTAHFNGVTDNNMLTGGAINNDGYCKTCHPSYNSHYNNSATPGGTSTSGDNCALCHEVHGEGMGTNTASMLIVGSGFTSKTSAASYFNGSNTGVCQVCHDAADGTGGGISHYNRTVAPDGHNATQVCTDCHRHDKTPSFSASAGTACNDCHSNPPVTGAHVNHSTVAGHTTAEDRSDCAACHIGADLYTYDAGADRTSGTPGRTNHGLGIANRQAVLATAVGYNSTNKSCATACHASTAVDGFWNDPALSCTACHGNPPTSGGAGGTAHSKHIAAGQTCLTCHGTNPTDTTHISVATGTDLQKLQDRAEALSDETTITVPTWNATNNTCANTACHNPSNDGKFADWDTSTSSCILCHRNDVASGQAMQTGSHTSHINNAAVIGDNFTCSSCHPATVSTAHLNGTLQINAALNYDGELLLPDTAQGTCNTTICHVDPNGKLGVAFSNAPSNWGVAEADPCRVCHESPSARGDHQGHFHASRVANGMACVSCHADTVLSNSQIKPGGKHLNGSKIDVVYSGNYNGSALTGSTYNSVPADSSCAATCHVTGNPKSWTPATSCESCHGDLSALGTVHARHIDITSGIANDRSECAICHTDVVSYTLVPDAQHQNGTTDLAVGISNTTCTSACHVSTAGVDGFWTDANGLNCDSCHDYPMADATHAKHITAGMLCSDCHGTVDAAGTHPLTHNHGKDIDAPGLTQADILQSKGRDYLNPTGLDVYVNDAIFNAAGGTTWLNSNVLDDVGNSCSNVYCHDPSNNNTRADWDDDSSSCTLCHGDNQVGTKMTSGSHGQHIDAASKFGVTITCSSCHPNNVTDTHFIGTGANTLAKLNKSVQFAGIITTQYQGEVNLPSTGVGTCSANQCHNNGKGANAITGFNWGTPVASDCQFCHDDPPASGRHGAHLGTSVTYGPYGGVASTNCADCHTANNNLTMTGQTTHMNGAINFTGGTTTVPGGIVANATVTSCNNCHGAMAATANANAALAKAQWNTAARLTCESCHGDFALANSKADNSGVIAPGRAGANYLTKGHGMATTPATAQGGSKAVAKACSACHDNTVAHISGVLDGVNRLQSLSGKTFGVLAESNDWCSSCHTGSMMFGHFANTQTLGNNSDDGLYCADCHDPHGQSGQDAMVASTVKNNTVVDFTDRTLRTSYSNATFTGVCQVCHDSAEVPYFNTSTNATTHNAGSNCTACHKHTDNPAFQASGCSGCHGGGTVGANNSNYWPDSSNARTENTGGRHIKHMERLAKSRYNETVAQLLANTGNGSSDSKQLVLCAYCHTSPGTAAGHGSRGTTLVNTMYNLWGAAPTLDNAGWAAGTNSGNCSNVNCHNNMTTPNGFGWYGPNASSCTMCHLAGAVDNLIANNIHPNSGLHKVVNTSTVQAHNHTLVGPPGSTGCTSCHDSVQPSTHIDGVAVADSGSNNDRFLLASSFTYIDAVTNQASCSSTSGLIATCHTDGGNWARLWSKDADSTSTTFGTTRCNVCHGQAPGGSSLGWRSGMTVNHDLPNINDVSKHNNCEYCHVAPSGPYATYVYGTHHENGFVETNNGAGVGYDAVDGSCLNFCHPSGAKKTMGASTLWANNALAGASPTCGECHDASGGALLEPYATTIGHGGGAHAKHLETSASNYADTGNNSAAATYSYGCANCHPNSITFHFNGRIDMTLNSTHGGPLKSLNNVASDPLTVGVWDVNGGSGATAGGFTASGTKLTRALTCTAAYCHSDGKANFNPTPNWYGGAYAGPDPCAYCHLNSPDGTSHEPHNVGIHYNNVYTGTTGVVKDTALRQNAHGNAATSTTISCNICHYDTVTVNVNANNTICKTCHTAGSSPATGDAAASIASKAVHVNGLVDVKFQNVSVLSRAQLRDPLANAPEVNDNWKRINGYKVDANSHDETWDTQVSNLTRPLDTATMYDPGTKNCTVACHNNKDIGWGATTISCSNCHTELPK
ncbi:MAG: CxxxxCH/CxxCH domain-containing protein [Desulfuromonadales bacterium]|nr:CxxxxCH/CxxCH domain-containing protein [Desulfuromonadales bacterium]